MTCEPPIPAHIWQAMREFLDAVQRGTWNKGGQIVLTVSPQGVVSACEVRGKIE